MISDQRLATVFCLTIFCILELIRSILLEQQQSFFEPEVAQARLIFPLLGLFDLLCHSVQRILCVQFNSGRL